MTTVALPSPASHAAPREPYRGIHEFRYIDAPIYFGRDFEARRLLRLVSIYRGVMLYGDSGVGKSSLVNAKAMPMAVDEGYAPERIRVQPVPGAEMVVERIARGDGEDLPSLFDDGTTARRISISTEEFLVKLQNASAVPEGDYPLLVFDQFEELVTLTEQAARRGRDSAVQAQAAFEAVVNAIVSVLRDEALRVKLLFVFREDYYAKLTKFFAHYPALIDNYLRLEPLHNNQLDTIIHGPLQAVDFGRTLDPAVTTLLKRELEARSDSDLLNLSEVQIACQRLWRADDALDMLKTQHVSGLLETYFSEAIGTLPQELREPAGSILDALVTESGTRDVVSEATLLELLQTGQRMTAAEVTTTLTALDETARVIRRERRNDVVVYEIVSEFLVPWIMRRKVEAQAKEEAEQRFARTRRRFRGLAIGALVLILLLFVVLVGREYQTSNKQLHGRVAELEVEKDSLAAKLVAANDSIAILRSSAEEQQLAAASAEWSLKQQLTRARDAQRNAEARARLAERTRDAAVAQSTQDRAARETAEEERDAAFRQRDEANRARAEAERIRGIAVADKNTAVSERNAAVTARDEALRRADTLARERNIVVTNLAATTAERDQLTRSLADLTAKKTATDRTLASIREKLADSEGKVERLNAEIARLNRIIVACSTAGS